MSQIATSIEQSKRLLDAGVPKESADMYYKNNLPWTDKEPRYSAVLSVGSPSKVLEWFNKGYTAGGKEPLSLLHFCFPAWSLSVLWQVVHELDKTYDFPSELSADELMETLVKTIIYRNTH